MATGNGPNSTAQPAPASQASAYRPANDAIPTFTIEPQADASAVSRLIEAEIIPRLMQARQAGATPQARGDSPQVTPAEAARFAVMPLTVDAEDMLEEVQCVLDRGVSVEAVLVDLLTPSARRLGQLWEADRCDFVQVSMGVWRLQEVMREIAQRHPTGLSPAINAPCALFSPMPGEQHSFGTLMVEEVFARAGWQTEILLEPPRGQVLKMVAEQPFDLVGLTVSCDCPSGTLADLVANIRNVSKTPGIQVLVGGRAVNAEPELVQNCGADGTALDAQAALSVAERLVAASRLLNALPA